MRDTGIVKFKIIHARTGQNPGPESPEVTGMEMLPKAADSAGEPEVGMKRYIVSGQSFRIHCIKSKFSLCKNNR